MHPRRTRFVTACQQLLALALVCAVLTPAANVINLNVVPDGGGAADAASSSPAMLMTAYGEESLKSSKVPDGPVDAKVTEIELTPQVGMQARTAPGGQQARVQAKAGHTQLTSLPQRVTGYGTVGVTWDDTALGQLSFQVRTQTKGAWSRWTEIPYDADHGPDPDSAEGRETHPGTDALLIGHVDNVQIRANAAGALPAGMKLAVIEPGVAKRTVEQRAAIDTSTMEGGNPTDSAYNEAALDSAESAEGHGDIALAAATYTPAPVIYSRAQWGANEALRDTSSLSYGEVHAGFVHHTVNANNYTPDEVPGLLRSIYAYHTQSRGWSDVGYNFLVDRFGRIWEGRAGGVDRPVVGAHTLNYNENSFAMSAIGNFETAQPSTELLQAYGVLFAWKLSLHGITASSTLQRVGSRDFQAINGHRDAGTTACPGKYLYAQIPLIRQYAASAQQGWTGRELESSLVGSAYPDLVVRRKSNNQAYIIPTNGLNKFSPVSQGAGWGGFDAVVATPDLTGDGVGDLLARTGATGQTEVRPGDGNGGFGQPVTTVDSLAGHDLISGVGDLDRDGHNDLVARVAGRGRLDAYLGNGQGGFKVKELSSAWGDYNLISGVGDITGDGRADVVGRIRSRLYLLSGADGVGFNSRVRIAGRWGRYDAITGFGDYTGDGRADLFVLDSSTGSAYLHPGKGRGKFAKEIGPIAGFSGMTALTGGGALTPGGAPDVVARSGDTLVVFRNAGTYNTGKPIATGIDVSAAQSLFNAGDWDRDGYGDILVRNRGADNLVLYRGDGQGHFAAGVDIAGSFSTTKLLAAVGDMTGDGWPDLMAQPSGGAMMLYPGNGMYGLQTAYRAYAPIKARTQIPMGRFDADGAPDSIFRRGKLLGLYFGNGPGGLTGGTQLRLRVKKYDWLVGVADMGINGHSGMVAREKKTGYLYLLPASASGFSSRIFLTSGMKKYDLVG